MSEIEDELERLGLDPVWKGKYWVIHCPQHQDRHKSCICNERGWITCFAGCKPIHINRISNRHINIDYSSQPQEQSSKHTNDYTNIWIDLEPLEEGIKGVPANVLNKYGWRKYGATDVFIPYFNKSKTKIPFYQIRHTQGERRFTFVKGESPMIFGLEVLNDVKKYLFVTEGTRDSIILRWAGVNAIALPSASSLNLLSSVQRYVGEHNLLLCWCGDRDEAGERLMSNIKIPYLDCRCNYKDIGEMLEAEGINKIKERYESYQERPD